MGRKGKKTKAKIYRVDEPINELDLIKKEELLLIEQNYQKDIASNLNSEITLEETLCPSLYFSNAY